MEHEDVKHVALDPFPAIKEAAQAPDRAFDSHPNRVLDRLAARHLVGDGTNAAYTRRDVRHFGVRAAAQERLEEAGWLEDAQLDGRRLAAFEADRQGPLPFDAGERFDFDRAHRFGHRGFSLSSSRMDSLRKGSAFA